MRFKEGVWLSDGDKVWKSVDCLVNWKDSVYELKNPPDFTRKSRPLTMEDIVVGTTFTRSNILFKIVYVQDTEVCISCNHRYGYMRLAVKCINELINNDYTLT
jgi:hypothetical protein